MIEAVCDSEKSLRFLKSLGLKRPDIVDEVVDLVLPKYIEKQDKEDPEHLHDIALIVEALRSEDSWQRRRHLVDALKESPFLWATSATGSSTFCKPGDLYFRSPELKLYFEDNTDAWFMSPEYEQYRDDFLGLGAAEEVRIRWRKPNGHGHVTLENWRGWNVRGLHGFDPQWSVDGLEFALNDPSVRRSEYIWNRILIPHNHLIKGEIESCSRQTFEGSTTETKGNYVAKYPN